MKNESLILEYVSRHPFEKTVEILTEKAQQKGWNIPSVHDLRQSLAKSGKHVKPVKIIEVCKPEYSGRLLELNDERIVSVLMPCRISVYQKDDGKAYVALINMDKLAGALPEHVAIAMKKAVEEVEEIVREILN